METKKCPHCATEVPINATTCSNCGQRLAEGYRKQTETTFTTETGPPAKRKYSSMTIFLTALAIVALLLIAFYL